MPASTNRLTLDTSKLPKDLRQLHPIVDAHARFLGDVYALFGAVAGVG